VWQALRRAPPWPEVSRAWEGALAGDDRVDPRFYGSFDAADGIELLTDNRAAFAARSSLHAGARRTLDVATYYLQADEVGRAAARELSEAAARGVRVRLVVDETIMQKKERELGGVLRLVDELRAAGVLVRLWRDPARPYDANHRKLLLADGEALLLGGRNLADHYAGTAWRDVELLIRGPSARSAQEAFEATFSGAPDPRPEPLGLLHVTSPANLLSHAGFVYLLQCLRAARRTVDVENAYYFSHEAVLRQLLAARRRGVRVRVFTNSAESNDLDYASYRLYAGFRALVDAGAEVWLRRGSGRTLHAKYFVVDGEWTRVGSSNLDYYSPRFCAECDVHARSAELGAALTAFFEEGIADARRADAAEIDAALRSLTFSRAFDALLPDAQ
jgi:cardiolipin synthase